MALLCLRTYAVFASVSPGVIHRPGNASKILFGRCLHLQWPKAFKQTPLPFSVLHSIQLISSLERCFLVIDLFVLLFSYLTVLNDFEYIRF